MAEVWRLVASDPVLSKNLALVRSITGFEEVSGAMRHGHTRPLPGRCCQLSGDYFSAHWGKLACTAAPSDYPPRL